MKKIGKSSVLMAVLDEIQTLRGPGEKTVYELLEEARAEGIQVSRHTMERRLTTLVREGKIKHRKGIDKGKIYNLYSQP